MRRTIASATTAPCPVCSVRPAVEGLAVAGRVAVVDPAVAAVVRPEDHDASH